MTKLFIVAILAVNLVLISEVKADQRNNDKLWDYFGNLQIDCESDAKLEAYIQVAATKIYGVNFSCDTSFPEKSTYEVYSLASALSGLCSFDLLSAKSIIETDSQGNPYFKETMTIRRLMGYLQGFDVSNGSYDPAEVRCELYVP